MRRARGYGLILGLLGGVVTAATACGDDSPSGSDSVEGGGEAGASAGARSGTGGDARGGNATGGDGVGGTDRGGSGNRGGTTSSGAGGEAGGPSDGGTGGSRGGTSGSSAGGVSGEGGAAGESGAAGAGGTMGGMGGEGGEAVGCDDPRLGTPCDGSDRDECEEGTYVCSGSGTLQCSDRSSTRVELCNGMDDDCDSEVDDGIVRDSNPLCAMPTSMGSVIADTGADSIFASGYDERWLSARLTEGNTNEVYLSATVTLYSPAGTDFDLYVRCVSCGGAIVGESRQGGLDGHWDTVWVRKNDDTGKLDDFDIVIEVRYYDSNQCAYWDLSVQGATSMIYETCFD